jgi:hypothetical protein
MLARIWQYKHDIRLGNKRTPRPRAVRASADANIATVLGSIPASSRHSLRGGRYDVEWNIKIGLTHCKDTDLKFKNKKFAEMKLRGLILNSYIHVSVSDLYISGIGLSCFVAVK